MTVWICATCGAEHPDTGAPPAGCAICLDDRQWVPPTGQAWTHGSELEPHRTFAVEQLEPSLHSVTVLPEVAIGQRTLLLQTPAGNLLWEPGAFISAELVGAVLALGPVMAISSSHPHLAGASVSWSHLVGAHQKQQVPIYWNRHDRRWIQRPDPAITLWNGAVEPLPGITLVQAGGHFPGSAVLHWPQGADGRGVLFSGDTVMVGPSRRTVSFMRSYPNQLPLSERLVRQIVTALESYEYDRIYGAFDRSILPSGARQVVRDSAERYIGWLRDDIRDPDEEL
jgi:glyoxylase-like metal-dependent hydrolase (beta-lactamase superfamily II)